MMKQLRSYTVQVKARVLCFPVPKKVFKIGIGIGIQDITVDINNNVYAKRGCENSSVKYFFVVYALEDNSAQIVG